MDTQSNAPDYHVLGGWLKFIVVTGYISAVLMFLSAGTIVAQLAQYSRYFSYWPVNVWVLYVLAVALPLAVAIYEIIFVNKIRHKDPTFLRFYHIFAIIALVVSVGALAITGFNIQDVASTFESTLGIFVGVFVWTLYFIKSKRVHVYMGSDEYLALSPLTRRFANKPGNSASGNDRHPEYDNDQSSPVPVLQTEHIVHSAPITTAAPLSVKSKQSPSPQTATQTAVSFNPDRCCICDSLIRDGYATLFTNSSGSEARIDRICYAAIYALMKSNDRQEVNEAGLYIEDKMDKIAPDVANYLERYIDVGIEFLDSPEGTTR